MTELVFTECRIGIQSRSWLKTAATYSEPGPGVTRVLGSAEHRALLPVLADWYREAGADAVWLDDAGNLVGRWEGSSPDARTLLIGSHQDTVRQGGAYDGIMGVLLPLAVLSEINRSGRCPATAVELIAFCDEEGTRFASTLIGSSAIAGNFNRDLLAVTDSDGVTLADALRALGSNPDQIGRVARQPEQVSGYVEVHIEQGPILEAENLPVGVVTAITGIERHRLTITGKAGHAGTTPMHLRKDALVRAARAVLVVDELCHSTDDLVGVVGQLDVTPGAVNVIPAEVTMSIELRSPDSAIRRRARLDLMERLAGALDDSGCQWKVETTYEQNEVRCAESVQRALAQAVEDAGYPVRRLFSGAGHDGLAMAHLTNIGMLFMRCKDGLSHHPDESVTTEDLEASGQVIRRFIESWPG